VLFFLVFFTQFQAHRSLGKLLDKERAFLRTAFSHAKELEAARLDLTWQVRLAQGVDSLLQQNIKSTCLHALNQGSGLKDLDPGPGSTQHTSHIYQALAKMYLNAL